MPKAQSRWGRAGPSTLTCLDRAGEGIRAMALGRAHVQAEVLALALRA